MGAICALLGALPLGFALAYLNESIAPIVQRMLQSSYDTKAKQLEEQARKYARERIKPIEKERDDAIAALESPYQQRMAEIAAEHERALAEVTAHYSTT